MDSEFNGPRQKLLQLLDLLITRLLEIVSDTSKRPSAAYLDVARRLLADNRVTLKDDPELRSHAGLTNLAEALEHPPYTLPQFDDGDGEQPEPSGQRRQPDASKSEAPSKRAHRLLIPKIDPKKLH